MTAEYGRLIEKASDAARLLTVIADEGEHDGQDDGCMVVCSVVRDCAYRIRREVERERKAHSATNACLAATVDRFGNRGGRQ